MSSSKGLVDCSGKSVLVVDDSEVNLKLASRYLEQLLKKEFNLNG